MFKLKMISLVLEIWACNDNKVTSTDISRTTLVALGSHLNQNGSAQKEKVEAERRSQYELSVSRE